MKKQILFAPLTLFTALYFSCLCNVHEENKEKMLLGKKYSQLNKIVLLITLVLLIKQCCPC